MLAVSSHVSMQGHHCLPLRVWLWGKCLLCVTVEVITDLEGDHTIRETFLLFSWNGSVCVSVCFFYVPFPEFSVVERMKETRQMAYLHCLMTWSSELRHELDTASIITSFLKNLVIGATNVWNCELRSHNHFHWSPPLQTFLTMHSTLSVLKASHLTFKQEYDSRLYLDSRWLAFGLILMVYAPSLLWFPQSDLNYLLWCTT